MPVIGCGCAVCASTDARDRRTRHAALLTWRDGTTVLVDTPPELRLQLLRERVERVDAVWFTHLHADHLHGIDDLRIFSIRSGGSVPAFASSDALALLERRFEYIFDPESVPEAGTSKPQISLNPLVAGGRHILAGHAFTAVEVPHGSQRVMGFRIGALGYITDAKRLPPAAVDILKGVEVLVLNALWFGDPHPTHFNVEEAVATAEVVGAERTYLTHLTHRVSHADLEARLPAGVLAAHDGLSLELPDPEDVGVAGEGNA